jgi:hypothetical protein
VQFLQPPDLGIDEREPDDKYEAVEGAPLDPDKRCAAPRDLGL